MVRLKGEKMKPITKNYVRQFMLRLEKREDDKLSAIREYFGNLSLNESIRKLIRDKKVN